MYSYPKLPSTLEYLRCRYVIIHPRGKGAYLRFCWSVASWRGPFRGPRDKYPALYPYRPRRGNQRAPKSISILYILVYHLRNGLGHARSITFLLTQGSLDTLAMSQVVDLGLYSIYNTYNTMDKERKWLKHTRERAASRPGY